MVEINADLGSYGTEFEVYNDWENCLAECWKDDFCTMVYWNAQIESCWYFKYGNVNSVKNLNGSSGEKINSTSESCPSSNPLLSGNSFSIISNYTQYNTNITITTTYFNFNYSTQKYCPDGTKQFTRGSTLVCIGLKNAGEAITGYEASALCKTDGGMSLTGPYSSEEFSYMSSEKAKYDGIFWVDGISNTTADVFEMEDDTHNGTFAYPWATQQPGDHDVGCCLYFPIVPSSNTVDDIK